MLASLIGVLAASAAPATAMSVAICDVGRTALRDLDTIKSNFEYDTYYAGVDKRHHDLLEACPKLLTEIPAGYPLADDAAWAWVDVGFPRQGEPTRHVLPTIIYAIDVPVVSADLRTATVTMGYSCTGLCGSGFVAHYIHTVRGWRRLGKVQGLFQS